MGNDVEKLIKRDPDDLESALESFIKHASSLYAFPELNEGNKRGDLWNSLYVITKSTTNNNVLKNSFIAIRLLSREKQSLNSLITDDWLELIKKHCGLDNDRFVFDEQALPVALEAQKSLCNIVYNSRVSADKCCQNGILHGIQTRIKKINDQNVPNEVKFFDMKLLFLLTALCPQIRKETDNLQYTLVQVLEEILKEAAENHLKHEELPPVFLTDEQVDMASEVLKALFNITVHIDESDAEIMANCFTLVEVLRNYLLISSNDLEKTWTLRNNVINLLTNMPSESYKCLLIPVDDTKRIPKKLVFEGNNMTAIYEMLMFLKAKFNDDPKISSQHEALSPVITVLLKGASSHRTIRKFLRNQILPPLKDVHSRPEQGSTLRNHLCRLLTTPITQLRDLVAEFLFILCKKSVTRMIKYTGYGNAAGLFAQRGLLAGGHDKGEDDYSSDSDSETEEYADHKHGINPVTGCYQEPHPSVFENMSEEQKEYEAMKLVQLMDNLMKCGTIKPCRVGEDGKPHAVEHILELQEALRDQQIKNNDDD